MGFPRSLTSFGPSTDNHWIVAVCGIHSPDNIPSQPTFCRFRTKLAKRSFAVKVTDVMRDLTRRMYEEFDGFGESVAMDSTDIKAWSNGGKKGWKKRRKGKKRRPARPGTVSDPDAGWVVKTNTEGNQKYVWGYKAHILCDTTWELPVGAIKVTAGNVHDSQMARPLLSEARFTYSKFNPTYVLADAAYSDRKLRTLIRGQYHAKPIIDPNPTHKRAFANTDKTAEWKIVYRRRTAIERLNGRLKGHRKLNSVRGRGIAKVKLHAMMAAVVCQAQALAIESRVSVRKAA